MRTKTTLAALLMLAVLAGCDQAKKIPLFNADARPLNRVASANELITEANNKCASYVARGWLTQNTVDKGFSPVLDNAAKIADSAEVLLRNGEVGAAKPKIEVLRSMLQSIRDQLAQIERDNK